MRKYIRIIINKRRNLGQFLHLPKKYILIIPLLFVFLWCNNINAMASNYLYKREFVKIQKEKGLCIECSTPVNGSIRCDNCNKRRTENRKQKYEEWKEKGLCYQCGNEVIKNKNLCEKHYLMQVSSGRLGSSKYWKEIKDLLKIQNYKCALSGDKISFDDGIELDHILPTTRGGNNDLSNVRWVTKQANRLKQNLTDIELKELCKKILSTI